MNHLYSGLPHEITSLIRKDSLKAEAQGRLSPEQLALIYREKWFHLFVPEEYGGLAMSLPDAVRLEERIAYADGSVGWVVTLCGGAAMFIGYFEEELIREIFTGHQVCLAGSGQASGSAKIINGGFEINGCWPYASGAPHATHFTANCVMNGSGQIQSFVFKKEEVTLHPTWKYIGLNATAGFSYSVKNLKIPVNRAFRIDPDHARLSHPVYRYPFLQLAQATIAVNTSGMCLCFFDLANDLLTGKQHEGSRAEAVKNQGPQLVTSSIATLDTLRKEFYASLDASWSDHVANHTITPSQLHTVSQTSQHLAQQSRNLVNQLYPYCGLNAARTETHINQVWRNINTASQHTLLLQT